MLTLFNLILVIVWHFDVKKNLNADIQFCATLIDFVKICCYKEGPLYY